MIAETNDLIPRDGKVTVRVWMRGSEHTHTMFYVDTNPRLAAQLAIDFVVYTVRGKWVTDDDLVRARETAKVTFAPSG